MGNDIEWTNQWCNWRTIIWEQSRAKYRTLRNTIAEVGRIRVLSRHKHWLRSICEIWGYPWQSRARDARVRWESVQEDIMRNSVEGCWQIKEHEKDTFSTVDGFQDIILYSHNCCLRWVCRTICWLKGLIQTLTGFMWAEALSYYFFHDLWDEAEIWDGAVIS